MLTEILAELKKQNPELECWTEGLKEESFDNNTLTISVPNQYFVEKYETECKDKIAEIASKKLGRKIYVQLQLLPSESEIIQPQEVVEPITKTDLKKFDGNPNFKDKTEMKTHMIEAEIKAKEGQKVVEIKPMQVPYSIDKVASFCTLMNEYFTFPTDKRKKSKVWVKMAYVDGSREVLQLCRGQLTFEDDGYGQLNTTHAKILLAIIHTWQEQGCQFSDNNGNFASVKFTISQLAKKLGYKRLGGSDYQRLIRQIKELSDIPNILVVRDVGVAFSFLHSVLISQSQDVREQGKMIIGVTMHPFIARQLWERKAFLRFPRCYKIKNPLAIKMLLRYDRVVVKGNRIQRTVKEIMEDLQIENSRVTNIIKSLKHAVKELNGYELNDKYNLKADIVKIGKDWTLIMERTSKMANILQIANSRSQSALKTSGAVKW